MQGWKSSLSVIRAGDLLHPWEHTWVYKASIHLSTMEKTKGQASWFFTIDTGWTLHSRHTSSYCILGISIALRTLYKNFLIANFFYIISRLLMHLRHFHLEIYYCKPLKKITFKSVSQICLVHFLSLWFSWNQHGIYIPSTISRKLINVFLCFRSMKQ